MLNLTTPEQAPETLRAILGCDISFRPSEIIAFLDEEHDAAIKQADRDHRNELAFCSNRREIDAAHQRYATTVTAISKKHTEDIQRVQQWEQSGKRLHALHETRDEAGEAREAARGLAAEGGAQ